MNRQKLEFFSSMYLECVCDQSRNQCLQNELGAKYNGLTPFKKDIQNKSYAEILDVFKKLMRSKMAIMFQERNRKPLTSCVNKRDIILLDRSNESVNDRIKILRSELLDFYCNCSYPSNQSQDTPCASKLLLNINDEIQIVQVKQEQVDSLVCSYKREPCVICYIRMCYYDRLSLDDKYIYFAFFYSDKDANNLLSIIECLRTLLSFRNDLMERITKDFSGNLYGKQKETAWSNAWLSIEKAGAHTDSSQISRLIQSAKFNNTNILRTLLEEDESNESQSKKLLDLIYNIEISMYYRAVISEGENLFRSTDNILYYADGEKEPYYKVKDVLQFSKIETNKIRVNYSPHDINDALLFGEESTCDTKDGIGTGGMPVTKEITCRGRYLRAFFIDILNNITKHAKEGSTSKIYLEFGSEEPGYLVFANEAKNGPTKNVKQWCSQENYRLKQSAEFDHASDPNAPKGISLGCIAHCMNQYGNFIATYAPSGNRAWFYIKLPIIKKESDHYGQTIDCGRLCTNDQKNSETV